MRLHRLRVQNYRGVVSREIEFADSGVTVIEGDNEAGKSSMMEAFDLLLTAQSSSKSKNVRAVQPSGRDVGTEVWADISCGQWRFEYFKRFNRQAETALTIVEPVREQMAGRTAHERVEKILAESLDRSLFDALRLLQSTDPKLGDLANSSALSQALDRAAGQASSGGGESPQTLELVAAVTTEYKKYFTVTQGRPTGQYAEAQNAAEETAAAVADRERYLAQAQEAADQLPRVAEAIRQLLADEQTGNVEVAQAAAAMAEAEAVRQRVDSARERVNVKTLEHQFACDAESARGGKRARLATLRTNIQQNAAAVAQTLVDAEAATAQAADLTEQAQALATRLATVREQLGAAESAARVAADRTRLAGLDRTLGEVARLRAELSGCRDDAAKIHVGADDVREATTLDREIAAATARLDAVAATVVVTRLGDTEVLVGGQRVDDRMEFGASAAHVIDIPGVARVEIAPGADSATLSAELAVLRERETGLVGRAGVETLAQIAPAAQRRAEALRRADEVERAIARELSGSSVDDLSAQRLDLIARLPVGEVTADAGDPAQLRQEERELTALVSDTERRRDAFLASARERRSRAATLAEAGERTAVEASVLDAELTTAAGEATDEALTARVAEAQTDLEEAGAELETLQQSLQRLDLVRLRTRVDETEAAQARLRGQLSERKQLQTALSTRLEMCRSDGRLDELSTAVAENKAAKAQLGRVVERAAGARALYETLQRKRNESRARYVDPFTKRLEQLAEPVFGTGVRFHVGDDFVVATRTLDGVTVDVDSLSGGAKEQLGLLARLACATLVDAADGVPLILDDALGYSDPTRLASMAQVLGASGGEAQIIVLTCTPDRYREVVGAKLIAV